MKGNSEGGGLVEADWIFSIGENAVVCNSNAAGISGFINPTTDYSDISFDALIGSGWSGDDDGLGLLFNATDHHNGNVSTYIFFLEGGGFGFSGVSSGFWYSPGMVSAYQQNGTMTGLYKITNGKLDHTNMQLCKTTATYGLKWPNSAYMKIKVESNKNHLRIWVNNKLEIDFTDTSTTALSHGTFGFIASSQKDSRFKDIHYIGTLATYTVTPNANGSNVEMDSTPVQGISTKTWKASLPIPKREGYAFKGWNTKADGTGVDMTASVVQGNPVNVTTDTNVYAQWVKLHNVRWIDSVTGDVLKEEQVEDGHLCTPISDSELVDHDWWQRTGYSYDVTAPITTDTVIEVLHERSDMFSISLDVYWKDLNNFDGVRPNKLSVELVADGEVMFSCEIDEASGWHAEKTVAAHGSDSAVVDYVWRIVGETNGYDANITNSTSAGHPEGYAPDIWTATLLHIGTRNIVVTKIWDDMSDIYGERPDVVTFEVSGGVESAGRRQLDLSDEDQVGGTSGNAWAGSIEVPRWNADEHVIDYEVVEHNVTGYDLIEVTGNMDDGYTFKNKVWGHVMIPETGSGSFVLISVISMIAISIGGAAATVVARKSRSRNRAGHIE